MDRGAWQATAHGVAELITAEQLTLSLYFSGLSQLSFQGASVLISWLQLPSAVTVEPKTIKSVTFTFSLSICREVIGLDAMILVF